MLTQEEFMDVTAMRRQGLTITEIADELGYHPATISKWLRAGGPPAKRTSARDERVMDERWARRVDELLEANERLLATSVFTLLRAEGFTGSYPTLARHVRALRGPRFRRADNASVPIETAPGEECQFDWSDCRTFGELFGLGELHCFGAILSWSRWRRWWFAPAIDREHTLAGLAAFYEHAGGVPSISRTDRMGALGTSRGRRFVLHAPVLDFARLHGSAIVVCGPRDAKRKGKIERPFRELKETFLEELVLDPPASLAELNARATTYLDERVHTRVHASTGETPLARIAREAPLLGPLPRRRYAPAYVEVRRVHRALPLVEWRGISYSVPPDALGQLVECRQPIGEGVLEVRLAGRLIARHHLAPGASVVWDTAHRRAAEAAALGRGRGRAHLRVMKDSAARSGDYVVEAVDLSRYDLDGAS